MKPSSQSLPAGQQLADAIAKSAPPERLAEVIAAALGSTTVTRAGVIEPDTRSRLEAAKILLSYSVGTPITRSEILSVSLDANSSIGLAERLKNSPALRRSLRTILESVEPTVDLKNSL
jgi:hypothetical protein